VPTSSSPGSFCSKLSARVDDKAPGGKFQVSGCC
jgi:hypothetical protein